MGLVHAYEAYLAGIVLVRPTHALAVILHSPIRAIIRGRIAGASTLTSLWARAVPNIACDRLTSLLLPHSISAHDSIISAP